jgi:alkanesulfonate monooxygenase SsuD/methylene tetrahydromethanopterin reductase-like flavin-dependent oxidoreductase (luciferase family)
MRALTETVTAVRQLLAGELVTMQGEEVQLDQVQMRTVAEHVLPIYIGAMRTKTLQLAGRIGDGTILTAMSSPAYVRWAWERIRAGMAEVGRTKHELVVYLDVKVGSDGAKARAVTRQTLAARMPWVDAHVDALGIGEQVAALTQQYGPHEIAEHIPDAWVDGFTAAGTPEHVIQAIQGIIEAGADSVVFQPLEGDPDGLDEYIEYLMPHFKLKQ